MSVGSKAVVKAATYVELVQAGYTFLGRRRCPRCGEDVAFFLTPKKRRAPFVLLESGKYLSHFATCLQPPPRREEGEKCNGQMRLI
jgi:ribosomal protein S27AE